MNNELKTIAFQGARYAFSEIASKQFFGENITCVPCKSFDNVFETVEAGGAEFGVLPLENSLTGSIHRNYDLMLEHNLVVVGEVFLRVEQHLIANAGVKLEEIKTVYSHPQALEQCRKFLTSLPDVEPIASYDTAGSVKMIRDNKMRDAGAIASKLAADTYGMNIIQHEIEDIPENFTRFHIFSKTAHYFGEPDKTSIVFSMKNIPGSLFKALSVFSLREIDLLKIESRPRRGTPWEYIFYLDFSGNMEQESAQNAIRHLEEMTNFLKILGSYPSGYSRVKQ